MKMRDVVESILEIRNVMSEEKETVGWLKGV